MTQPTPDQTPVESYETKRDLLHDRQALALIGGGLVVVAAIGVFVVKPMLSSSSSDSATGTVANAHVHPAGATSASPSVTPPAVAAPTPAPKLVVRDPFLPLYVAPSGAAGGASAASAAPSAASTTPITQVSTVIVPEPGPTVTTSATAKYTLVMSGFRYEASGATTVEQVTVLLNGHKASVSVGKSFPSGTDGPFELMSLTKSGVASFAYGDNSFTLHVGETQYEN